MDYLGLTTTEQILNVLTVDEEDLSQEQIDGYGLIDDLTIDLVSQLPTWADVLATGSPVNQARLRSYAKYFCAGTLAVSAQVFVLKKATDGNNEGQRSDKDGWEFLSLKFLSKAQGFMDDLLDDLGLTPSVTITPIIGRVIPDRDVITEPRS
jgi:hypothetical protein